MVLLLLLLDKILLLSEVIPDSHKDIVLSPGISLNWSNWQIKLSLPPLACMQISVNSKESSKLNSKSTIIKLKGSHLLNQLPISFPKPSMVVDFSHTIPSILWLDLIKRVRVLSTDMMLLEAMEAIKPWLKEVVPI